MSSEERLAVFSRRSLKAPCRVEHLQGIAHGPCQEKRIVRIERERPEHVALRQDPGQIFLYDGGTGRKDRA